MSVNILFILLCGFYRYFIIHTAFNICCLEMIGILFGLLAFQFVDSIMTASIQKTVSTIMQYKND